MTLLALHQLMLTGLVVLFLGISVALLLIILIQRPQGGGLSGAFGAGSGSGSGQTAFGVKTGDALTITTCAIFAIFVMMAIGLNFALRPQDDLGVLPGVGEATEVEPADGETATDGEGDGETAADGEGDGEAPAGDGEAPADDADPTPPDAGGATGETPAGTETPSDG